LSRRSKEPIDGLPRQVTVVLAGHRAAGKSTLLPHVARVLERRAIDLDHELERREGRSIRAWFTSDPASFRAAERALFESLPAGVVVAVGGGFLSSHPDALRGTLPVLVPVSFETFRERLLADATRPRLRPELGLEDELRQVFDERERLHRRVPVMPLVDFVLAMRRSRARRVVTLPPGVEPIEFATLARREGADLLELRTDLVPSSIAVSGLSEVLPLLVAERGSPVPPTWRAAATLVDSAEGSLRSLHAPTPLTTAEALAQWKDAPSDVSVKHVEPLGELGSAHRLLETQAALIERFGPSRVTVLATGPLATAFRCVLAERNALDFLALDPSWSAAPGQRLLRDAVRSHRSATHDPLTRRLAILGSPLVHSKSPRLHAQPFDRLEVPADVELGSFLRAVQPHYRGFAVTNPLKNAAARTVQTSREAVNTLVREGADYEGYDTDREGAAATLSALTSSSGARRVTVLGNGGVGTALRAAAEQLGISLEFLRLGAADRRLQGAVVWTWPSPVKPPAGLRLDGCSVAVISYGAPGRVIARHVRELGGTPLRLGPRWFIAQARRQKILWETAG
jgi:shikimate kinase